VLIVSLDAAGRADETKQPAAAAVSATATGRDLFVDPAAGDDRADGLAPKPRAGSGPVKTIARGIKLAMAGDTVHLAPATYREAVVFHDRHGEPGRPIVLDGHGATIEGADLLQPAEWEQVSPGLYRNDRLYRPQVLAPEHGVVERWFYLFDGRMNHMGRSSKAPSPPLKRPEDLKPGEWTIVVKDHAFYIRIDPSRSLAACKIALPRLSSAVLLSGHCSHIVVRNLTGTHVLNDGYNLHDLTRDAVFENIAAIECGDDGFSAHDDCQVRVDGFRSIRNSTGITNTGHSQSENRRVWIQDCIGFDLYFLDEGYRDKGPRGSNRHKVVDSVIISSAARCVSVDGSQGLTDPCRLSLENVLIRRVDKPEQILVAKNSVFAGDHVATFGVSLVATGGTVELRHSLIGGRQAPGITLSPGVTWLADHNHYALGALQWNGASFNAARFEEYRRASQQDVHSRWELAPIEEQMLHKVGAGVNPARLPTP
jgi:hypothetical protein